MTSLLSGDTNVTVRDGATARTTARPVTAGKFLAVGAQKLQLRGVTYGTFRPGADGSEYPEPGQVAEDFAAMAAAGANSLRVYTVPPAWLLDAAGEHGLRVMVGLPWEGHIAFLDSRATVRSIERRVRDGVRACAGHPAVLAYSVGNEIPAPIARWHGRARVERFIERLYDAAKREDPDALVTYVNYPTTEYLQLPFLDFLSFNVFLESQRALEDYLARLHVIAGDRPVVLTEIGLDSSRHGLEAQAVALEWQLASAFESGCAGAYVFSWTDEWHRGGFDVTDWDFGLVDRDRRPKPALDTVARAFERVWRAEREWPAMSVVVCTHNGEGWLPGCLDALRSLDYPSYEVIVVDDGSTDRTAEIASTYQVALVQTDCNHGLSHARNLGAAAARGEIVAFLDDDARPDPQWLRYLALSFEDGHAAVGGPNIAPEGDGLVADSVARSPGGPIHVLISDEIAEHVPGCNMAVRKETLDAIGGFDPRFEVAGDDVDACWRIQESGNTIGFSPAAMVWHHRRNSVRAYLRQQYQYGKAEALLERKWPRRYNRIGHLSWSGRVYGSGPRPRIARRARINYGTWGSRLFQSIYEPAPGQLSALASMPETYLLVAALAALSALGALWAPLFLALPVLALLAVGVVTRALTAVGASGGGGGTWPVRAARGSLIVALHLLQPLARLVGRLRHGLSPWRRRGPRVFAFPRRRDAMLWSERWAPLERWIGAVEERLLPDCHTVVRGADWDRWDLEVRGGAFGVARVLCTVEEHGAGRQLVRFRAWPRWSRGALLAAAFAVLLAVLAVLDGAPVPAGVLAATGLALAGTAAYDCALALGVILRAVGQPVSPMHTVAPAAAPQHAELDQAGRANGFAVMNGDRAGDAARERHPEETRL